MFSFNTVNYFNKCTIYFSYPKSWVMWAIIDLHDYLMFFIINIFLVVFIYMFLILFIQQSFFNNINFIKFYVFLNVKDYNDEPLLEFFWTFFPAVLLAVMSWPSFTLLYAMEQLIDPFHTVIITGNQWYWTYQYSDFDVVSDIIIQLDSLKGLNYFSKIIKKELNFPVIFDELRYRSKIKVDSINEVGEEFLNIIYFMTPVFVKNSFSIDKLANIALDINKAANLAWNLAPFNFKFLNVDFDFNFYSTSSVYDYVFSNHSNHFICLNDSLYSHLEEFNYESLPALFNTDYRKHEINIPCNYDSLRGNLALSSEISAISNNLYFSVVQTKVISLENVVSLFINFFANNETLNSFQKSIEDSIVIKHNFNYWDLIQFIGKHARKYESTQLIYDAIIITDDNLPVGYPRLLCTDQVLVLPANVSIRLLITSNDVIHSWALPSHGIKMDAIPGRINQVPFLTPFWGTYWGQCSELCGINHGFMPIEVRVVCLEDYLSFIKLNISYKYDKFCPLIRNLIASYILNLNEEVLKNKK